MQNKDNNEDEIFDIILVPSSKSSKNSQYDPLKLIANKARFLSKQQEIRKKIEEEAKKRNEHIIVDIFPEAQDAEQFLQDKLDNITIHQETFNVSIACNHVLQQKLPQIAYEKQLELPFQELVHYICTHDDGFQILQAEKILHNMIKNNNIVFSIETFEHALSCVGICFKRNNQMNNLLVSSPPELNKAIIFIHLICLSISINPSKYNYEDLFSFTLHGICSKEANEKYNLMSAFYSLLYEIGKSYSSIKQNAFQDFNQWIRKFSNGFPLSITYFTVKNLSTNIMDIKQAVRIYSKQKVTSLLNLNIESQQYDTKEQDILLESLKALNMNLERCLLHKSHPKESIEKTLENTYYAVKFTELWTCQYIMEDFHLFGMCDPIEEHVEFAKQIIALCNNLFSKTSKFLIVSSVHMSLNLAISDLKSKWDSLYLFRYQNTLPESIEPEPKRRRL